MKKIGIFIGAVLIIYIASVIAINLPKNSNSSDEVSFNTPSDETTNNTNLKSEDLAVGNGDEAKTGDSVSVLYTGKLTDGTTFDSNTDKTNPFTFTLGNGSVIQGWDQGVVGMKVGGKRKLTIPPELAYGEQANGQIPANSTLIFDIELLQVTKASPQSPNPDLNL